MRVLGGWNWYLPGWLGRIPHVASEEETAPAAAREAPEKRAAARAHV